MTLIEESGKAPRIIEGILGQVPVTTKTLSIELLMSSESVITLFEEPDIKFGLRRISLLRMTSRRSLISSGTETLRSTSSCLNSALALSTSLDFLSMRSSKDAFYSTRPTLTHMSKMSFSGRLAVTPFCGQFLLRFGMH